MEYRKICGSLLAALFLGGCSLGFNGVALAAPGSEVAMEYQGLSKKEIKKLLKQQEKLRKEQEKLRKEQEELAKEQAELDRKLGKTKAEAVTVSSATGMAYFNGLPMPANYQTISIFGKAVASQGQAIALIKATNPAPQLGCTVEQLVAYYWQEAERENIRPDIALAQALVETGCFRYGGQVTADQNNYCGLGTTGNGVKGAYFSTPEIGVRAHIQHLVAYSRAELPKTTIVDPRYNVAHNLRKEKGLITKWYGLNGTWAMGANYCEKIMTTYQKMVEMKPVPVAIPKAIEGDRR